MMSLTRHVVNFRKMSGGFVKDTTQKVRNAKLFSQKRSHAWPERTFTVILIQYWCLAEMNR